MQKNERYNRTYVKLMEKGNVVSPIGGTTEKWK